MSRFTAPLVVTPTEDYKRWIVLSSAGPGTPQFGYDIGAEDSGITILIPAAFETDFASIPFYGRWLIKTWGRHTNPAIIHDYLYRGGVIIQSSSGRLANAGNRKRADQIMLEAMEVMGVKKWRRLTIYWGLRAGGGFRWKKIRRGKK